MSDTFTTIKPEVPTKPVSDPVLIHKPLISQEDMDSVRDALASTFVSGDGPACRQFEKELQEFLGIRHALFMNSCTSALDLAFRAKRFKPGSEVIVPNFTYTSTALGPLINQLNVRLADVNPDNGNLDPTKLRKYINPNTVAVVAVDYAGNPAEMDQIQEIAKESNLYLVHDTAQSIGAKYKGQYTGHQADASTFSFHGTKNMTTGEGGALVTNDDDLAAAVKIMREKGTDKYSFLTDNITRGFYEYKDIGGSYVQSNINGALGVTQLRKLTEMNNRRREIAHRYLRELGDIDAIDFLRVTENAEPNWHLFGILVPPGQKYLIMDRLRERGIMANVHYTPLHRNEYYKHLGTDEQFPGSMSFFNRLLRIPIYPVLTDAEQTRVIESVHAVLNSI